jgi:hypothetical protein
MASKGTFRVWYLSGEQINDADALVLHEDVGPLSLDENHIVFNGSRVQLRIDREKIGTVSMEPLKLSQKRTVAAYIGSLLLWWPVLAIALLVSVVIAFFMKNWLPVPICLAPVLLLHLISFIMGFLAGMSVKWIKINYSDELGNKRSAYFYDKSGVEFFGMLGGTKKLYEMIVS